MIMNLYWGATEKFYLLRPYDTYSFMVFNSNINQYILAKYTRECDFEKPYKCHVYSPRTYKKDILVCSFHKTAVYECDDYYARKVWISLIKDDKWNQFGPEELTDEFFQKCYTSYNL